MKILFFLIANIFAVSGYSMPEPGQKAKVIVETIKLQSDSDQLLIPAKVEAKLVANISADVEGIVTAIRKPLGASVKAGEVVLYIENRDPGFTYAKVAVRSPIAGILNQLPISLLTKVNRGDRLFSTLNPNLLKLQSEIPSAALSALKVGQEAEFLLDGQRFPVKISGVSPSIDSRTGTAPAELEFFKSKSLPALGSIGQIQFKIFKGQQILISESAISYQEGKSFIRTINAKGKIEKKFIELGEQKDSRYAVRSGLSEGDKVVIRSSRALKADEEVELQVDESKK